MRMDVATGGNAQAAIAAAVGKTVKKGSVTRVSVAHDDGCACVSGAPTGFCTCEIVELTIKRVR